jgi:hypothetical protein
VRLKMDETLKQVYFCLLSNQHIASSIPIHIRIEAEIEGHITFCHTGVNPEPSELVKFFYKHWIKYK